MKLRNLALTIVGIALSVAVFAGNSIAAPEWAACTPAQIGPYGDHVRLQVTGCNVNPAGAQDGWMALNTTGTDQMMATVLTAMSLNKPIAIQFDNAATTHPTGYNYAFAVIFNNM